MWFNINIYVYSYYYNKDNTFDIEKSSFLIN